MLQTLQRCVLKPKLDQMQVRRLILGIESSCDDSGAAIIKYVTIGIPEYDNN